MEDGRGTHALPHQGTVPQSADHPIGLLRDARTNPVVGGGLRYEERTDLNGCCR
jgi:hypothetical protein